ncbi:4'-phosphopantetheinyl transferase superfamily protein [Variovorax sp. H27-G14]|uniref:4'-phosphopantetheinyl transferase family protein n=1 Tax=Variovorax sp. H27-G14 TaxID=3111914 RepID=UPI0038FC63EF
MTCLDPVPIAAGDIHLWFSFHGEHGDVAWSNRCSALLEAHELRKQAAFHFARDRHQYLLTRALVRTVLSRYAPVAPQEWRFTANANGRPQLVDPGTVQTQGLEFNLSHTRGLVVMGVTRHAMLGVDAEYLSRPAPLSITDRVFSADESCALQSLPPARQPQRFYELWTLKESYVKARGLGMQIPLDQVGFLLDQEDRIELNVDAELCDAPERWDLWQLRPSADHLVAVCAETPTSTSSRVTCRDIFPMLWEKDFAVPVTRRTMHGVET